MEELGAYSFILLQIRVPISVFLKLEAGNSQVRAFKFKASGNEKGSFAVFNGNHIYGQ